MSFIKNTFEILWTIWCLFIASFFLLINFPILIIFTVIFGEGKNNIVDQQHYINYIKKQGPKFKIKTKNIDEEISKVCAPQLVCPVSNSRFLLNAANAR